MYHKFRIYFSVFIIFESTAKILRVTKFEYEQNESIQLMNFTSRVEKNSYIIDLDVRRVKKFDSLWVGFLKEYS